MREIKRRVKARLELCSEIVQLESGNFVSSSKTRDAVPSTSSCQINRFAPTTWENYQTFVNALGTTNDFHISLVTPADLFYELTLVRANCKLFLSYSQLLHSML